MDSQEFDRDSQLMLAVQSGDRQAFAALFKKYAGPLHHFVFRFVGSAAIAEELVQEIFFKLYRAAPNYQPKGRFSTYLYRVATNHCLNEVRRADYKTRFESLDQPGPGGGTAPGLSLPAPASEGAEEALAVSQLASKLQELLLALPKNQRAALLLHRMDALSHQEIADALETSVSAIKSLIHRARKTLQQRLEAWNEEAQKIR